MSTPANVLILSKDLLFSSQLHGAVQRAGRQGRTCLSQPGCLQQLEAAQAEYIIIDLAMPDLNLAEVRVAAGPDCQLIGYAPHVREDLLAMAQQAGCDTILTRGQAAKMIEKLLRPAASSQMP